MKILSECQACSSIGLLVMRVSIGCMMMFGHGLDKLLHFSQKAGEFSDPLGVGSTASLILVIFAEFFCSLLVIIGFATRLSVVPLIVTIAVAVLVIHTDDPWQKKEFALLYFVPFLTLMITGAGRYSIDGLICAKCCKSQDAVTEGE